MKERFFSMRIAIYVSLTILLLSGITCIVDVLQLVPIMKAWLNSMFEAWGMNIAIGSLVDFSSFDLLMSQISNTFIVLSLTVVLSTNVGCVYWIDIKDHKLVEPVFSCFIAIMTYLLSNLGFSIVVYLLGEEHSLLISFLVSIMLLMWLSYKMISVYFGRSRMKRRLMLEYAKNKWMVDLCEIGRSEDGRRNVTAIEEYRKDLARIYADERLIAQFDKFVQKWSQIETTEKIKELADISREKLQCYEEGIRENSIRALNENNKDIIDENIQLIAPMDSSQAVLRLLSEIDVTNPGYAADLLYQLHVEGNYNPRTEEVRIYAKTLIEQLIDERCAPESIYNMAKLLGSLEGKEDYLEILQNIAKADTNEQIDNCIMEKVVPLYDNEINLSCYKLVDEIFSAYEGKNKVEFDRYLNNLIWIKNKLEQEINTVSMEIVSRIKKYPLMMRRVPFLNKEQGEKMEQIFGKNDDNYLDKICSMNIYVFMDNYNITNMDEFIRAQSKYEKLRSIFGDKNPEVLRARTELAWRYNEVEDYMSTYNLFETNKAEIIDDEQEAELSNSIKAVALDMCGYWGEAWEIANSIYKKYHPIPHMILESSTLETVWRNASDVLYNHGDYERAYELDEMVFMKDLDDYAVSSVKAYHRMVVSATQCDKNRMVTYGGWEKEPLITEVTEAEWEDVYTKCKEVLGEDHSITLKAKANYMVCNSKLSEEERISSLREIYERRRVVYGDNHPETTRARVRLANRLVSRDNDDRKEAIQHYRGVYDIRKHVLGELHPEAIAILFSCWKEYLRQENTLLANLIENKIQQIEQNLENMSQRDMFLQTKGLISGYERMGNADKVIALYQYLYQKQVEIYGQNSQLAVYTMYDIATKYAENRNYAKAIECFGKNYEGAYVIRDLSKMYHAKLFEGLYRVKMQYPDDTTSSGSSLIREYFDTCISNKKLTNQEYLMEKTNYLVQKASSESMYEDMKADWKNLYQELCQASEDYTRECLLVLYSVKRALERRREMNDANALQKEMDEILEALDNL